MEGKQDNEAHAGVIPRSIHHIFEALERSSSEYPLKFMWLVIFLLLLRYTVRVSHMELYNEELRDLLGTENKQLRIYEGKDTLSNLTQSINSKLSSIPSTWSQANINTNTHFINEGLMDVTGKKGCTVNNLEEVIVSNAQSIFSVIENSCRKRQTAETLLNPYSRYRVITVGECE